ncbi:MAG: type II secretion system protein [Tepidisphaeraceae bacterium]
MKSGPKYDRGFSLLEMVIVIGIIAVLATLGFIGFGAVRRGQETRNTKANLEIARSMFNAFVNSAQAGGNTLSKDLSTGTQTNFYIRLAPPDWLYNVVAYGGATATVNYENLKTTDAAYARSIDFYNVPRREGDVLTGTPIPMNVPTTAFTAEDTAAWVGQWQLANTVKTLRRLKNSPDAKAMWSTLRPNQIIRVGSDDFLIDAWGRPLMFVPGSGVRGVMFGEGTTTNGYVKADPTAGGSLEAQALRSPDGRAFWMSSGPDGNFQTHDDNVYSFDN